MKDLNTPWETIPLNKHKGKALDFEVLNCKGDPLFFITNHPDRVAFLLKAVNNHKSLVKSVEDLLYLLENGYHKERFEWDEAKQLLTKLKSEPWQR